MSEEKPTAPPEAPAGGQPSEKTVALSPIVLCRIEDDPAIVLVPIGERVPKRLRLWMNRDAVFFHAQTCVNALRFMAADAHAAYGMVFPVRVVRAGEEPVEGPPAGRGGGRIIRPDMIVPDIGGKR